MGKDMKGLKFSFCKKDSKEELEFTMYCLVVVCVSCLLFCLARNLLLGMRLLEDLAGGGLVRMLPENVTLVVLAVCSVLIYRMQRHVQRGQVFTKRNSDLIMWIGLVLELNGIAQMVMNACWAERPFSNTVPMVFLLLGVFFLFIACLFKVGIRMQEEQDLTV